jgi:hypothetical protein
MSIVVTVVLVVLGVLLLLAMGGMLANSRRRRALEPGFEASLDEVNRRLAAAHAQDKGWEPAALEAAAREAFAGKRPGEEVRDQVLVQVIDRPGTDEDKAVFRFATGSGTAYLTMGRRDGAWVGERVEPA